MIPVMEAYIRSPDMLTNSARGATKHNTAARGAIKHALKRHIKKYMPAHFRQTNRTRYKHKPRQPNYKRSKRYWTGSITDLVHSGSTRNRAVHGPHKDNVGLRGKATSGNLTARSRFRLPFPVSSDQYNERYVRIHDMIREMETWTQDEAEAAATEFEKKFTQLIDAALKNTKTRRVKS